MTSVEIDIGEVTTANAELDELPSRLVSTTVAGSPGSAVTRYRRRNADLTDKENNYYPCHRRTPLTPCDC